MDSARPHWTFPTKLTIALLTLALIVYLLFRFSIVIPPFILAAILAYIISPLAGWFHKRMRLPFVLAILLAYLVILLAASAFPLVLIPLVASEVSQANVDLANILQTLEQFRNQRITLAGQTIYLNLIIDNLLASLQGLLEPVISHTLGLLVDVVSSIVWIIFIFIISFYLVKDGEKLRLWIEVRIPPAYRMDFIRLRGEIGLVWSAFFRGQILLAIVVAGIFTTSGLLLGLPFAFIMGLLAGLLEFLPSIGHGIWLTLASILAFFIGSSWLPLPNWLFMLLLIGLHIVFQQFDLNYLIPRIIGRSLHLPPLVVILGIVTGAVLAGVMGIPLAAPTIASARILGRYIYANLFDLDPFAVESST